MTLVPGPSQPGFAETLPEFLRSELSANASLVITGHSLGGALSPVVALTLSDRRNQWDPNGWATLSCVPSAGPTPGNQDFATYYDSKLGEVTTRVHNSIDVVPHGWLQPDLAQIPNLYSPSIAPDVLVQGLADTAIAISQSGNYAQIVPAAPAVSGSVNAALISASNTDFQNFVTQMIYQHVDSYFALFGMSGYLWIVDCVKQASDPLPGPNGVMASLQSRLERRILINNQRSRTVL